ncbi:DGAT2 [Symbiodinium natans]|uniref:DGAT2 protein n=1 Tax=Symbiodinium natans TaxID=878477 RepID=A0A812NZZ6_9DINO|nr:DGAT2 [Symbiodinium natans]
MAATVAEAAEAGTVSWRAPMGAWRQMLLASATSTTSATAKAAGASGFPCGPGELLHKASEALEGDPCDAYRSRALPRSSRCGVRRPAVALEVPTADPAGQLRAGPEDVGDAGVKQPLPGGARKQSARVAAMLFALQRCVRRRMAELWSEWKEAETNADDQTHPFAGSLCSLSSVPAASIEEEEDVPQWLQLSRLGDVREWYRSRHVGRVLSLWRMLAAGSSARRLIRNVCLQFRCQALTRRSFGALVGHWRWSSARTHRITQAVIRWVDARHQSRVRQALGVWRLRGAKGGLRRRGAKALGLFLTATRLRRWVTGWRSVARQERRRSQGLSDLATRKRLCLGRKSCKVWRDAARRCVAARSAAVFLEVSRIRNIIRRWAGQWKAEVHRSTRLCSAAWQGLALESKRMKAGAAVQRRGHGQRLRSAWMRWSIASSLNSREAMCRQRAKTRRLGVTLRSWQNLQAAKVFAAHSTLLDAFRKWNRVVGHLFNERDARELMVGDGCSAWRQRRSSQCLWRSFELWGQVARAKRKWRRRIREAKDAIEKLAIAQALWFWHGHAREAAAKEDHLQRASMALQAMVSASRWARAHDLLIRWFVRSKATRIMCNEADLSHEGPSAISHKDGSGMSEASAHTPRQRLSKASPSLSPSSTLARHPDASTCLASLRSPRPRRPPEDPLLDSQPQPPTEHVGDPKEEETPTAPKQPRPVQSSAVTRWLKFTVSLWLPDAAVLPVLQWACSAWRGAHLQAKLRHLRWWAFVLKMRKLRTQDLKRDLKRLRAAFKGWFEAVASQLQEAVAAAEAELRAISAGGPHEETGLVANGAWMEPVTQMAMRSHQNAVAAADAAPSTDVDLLVWVFSSWSAWARLTRT